MVKLDGNLVDWSMPSGWNGSLDRAWISVRNPSGGLSEGPHRISFELAEGLEGMVRNRENEVVRQVCSVEINQYGVEKEFNAELSVSFLD